MSAFRCAALVSKNRNAQSFPDQCHAPEMEHPYD